MPQKSTTRLCTLWCGVGIAVGVGVTNLVRPPTRGAAAELPDPPPDLPDRIWLKRPTSTRVGTRIVAFAPTTASDCLSSDDARLFERYQVLWSPIPDSVDPGVSIHDKETVLDVLRLVVDGFRVERGVALYEPTGGVMPEATGSTYELRLVRPRGRQQDAR